MRWKDSKQDAIGVAKLHKFHREVAAVAVEDQKTLSDARFRFCTAMEDLLKPGKSYLIIGPSGGRVRDGKFFVLGHKVVNPARLNPSGALIDESGR